MFFKQLSVQQSLKPTSSTEEDLSRRSTQTDSGYLDISLGQHEGSILSAQVYIPYRSDLNPAYPAVKTHLEKWVIESKLLDSASREYTKFVKADFAKLAAYTYRRESEEQLKTVAEFIGWLFCHDDFRDDKKSPVSNNPEKVKEVNLILKDTLYYGISPTPDTPIVAEFPIVLHLARSLNDIRTKLILASPQRNILHFCDAVDQYFQANVWEAQNRKDEKFPSYLNYIEWRRHTSAVYPCFEIGAIFRNAQLSEEIRGKVLFEKLKTNAADSVCFINDIFSLLKEIKEGDLGNLILVLNAEDRVGIPKALEKSSKVSDAEVRNFEFLLTQFATHELSQLEPYIELMTSWMKGNFDWSTETKRYNIAK